MNKIYALSGFLGLPTDWEPFPFLTPITEITTPLTKNSILVGYSMGGRQILQHLIQHPHHYKAAIIISAHPGLQTAIEKQTRADSDTKWASRFLSDPWKILMRDWNSQSIFTNIPDRQEHNYSRKRLSDDLLKHSLAKQSDLRDSIAQLDIPILWITGELDYKFTSLADSIELKHSRSKKIIAPDAGHRVPWENTKFFTKTIELFIGDTYDNDASSASGHMDMDQNISRY